MRIDRDSLLRGVVVGAVVLAPGFFAAGCVGRPEFDGRAKPAESARPGVPLTPVEYHPGTKRPWDREFEARYPAFERAGNSLDERNLEAAWKRLVNEAYPGGVIRVIERPTRNMYSESPHGIYTGDIRTYNVNLPASADARAADVMYSTQTDTQEYPVQNFLDFRYDGALKVAPSKGFNLTPGILTAQQIEEVENGRIRVKPGVSEVKVGTKIFQVDTVVRVRPDGGVRISEFYVRGT